MEEDQNKVKENDWSEHVASCWQGTQYTKYFLSASFICPTELVGCGLGKLTCRSDIEIDFK